LSKYIGLCGYSHEFNLRHGQIEFEPIASTSKEVIDFLNVYSMTNRLYISRIVYSEQEKPLDHFIAIIHGKFSIDVVNTVELT